MLTLEGRALLADFDSARVITQEFIMGGKKGTKGFIAPEVWKKCLLSMRQTCITVNPTAKNFLISSGRPIYWGRVEIVVGVLVFLQCGLGSNLNLTLHVRFFFSLRFAPLSKKKKKT